MRHAFTVIVSAVLALTLVCCASPSAEPSEADDRAASIERLREQSELTEAQANALLDLLVALGYEGQVLFSYPATDEDGVSYDHIWIGEQTVDVYFAKDGQVVSVQQGGIAVYENGTAVPGKPTEQPPTVPEESADAVMPSEPPEEESPEPTPPTEPELPPADMTLTVDELTEQVIAGEEAYLYAHGRPGEQYRIEVHYKSGVSTAKGLEAQTAAEDGSLTWTWKVSARTAPGSYHIKLIRMSDERDLLELPFSVDGKES